MTQGLSMSVSNLNIDIPAPIPIPYPINFEESDALTYDQVHITLKEQYGDKIQVLEEAFKASGQLKNDIRLNTSYAYAAKKAETLDKKYIADLHAEFQEKFNEIQNRFKETKELFEQMEKGEDFLTECVPNSKAVSRLDSSNMAKYQFLVNCMNEISKFNAKLATFAPIFEKEVVEIKSLNDSFNTFVYENECVTPPSTLYPNLNPSSLNVEDNNNVVEKPQNNLLDVTKNSKLDADIRFKAFATLLKQGNQQFEVVKKAFHSLNDIEAEYIVHFRRLIWENYSMPEKDARIIFEENPFDSKILNAAEQVNNGWRMADRA